MRIELISQLGLGSIQHMRVGDCLNECIREPRCREFRFAVAYMRSSGLNRLALSVNSLLERKGCVSGAVGIDDGITSVEALETLLNISSTSTVFHTTSGFIYHPKLYIMSGERYAITVVGSANLTRNGLFRNVELSAAVHLNFESSVDFKVYNQYDSLVKELLNTTHPNVQPIADSTVQILTIGGLIRREAQTREPGPPIRSRKTQGREENAASGELEKLFPPLRVPSAPPIGKIGYQQPQPQVIIPPSTAEAVATFIMQLSNFDSSHRTSVPGTPEVLIPHAAIGFFPNLSFSDHKYPDAYFDVVLNTPTGSERHRYRLWYYEERASGTRIDEYRLRMNHDTVDLSAPGGGDLLVINKLPEGSDPGYEVTILPRRDPTFSAFLDLCKYEIRGKKWGFA